MRHVSIFPANGHGGSWHIAANPRVGAHGSDRVMSGHQGLWTETALMTQIERINWTWVQ
jgi:hypothetical protein